MQITYTNSISGQQHNHDKMTATFHHAILYTIKSIFSDLKVNSDNYDKHIEDATFFAAYEKKKKELEQLLEDWENVQLEIEMVNS